MDPAKASTGEDKDNPESMVAEIQKKIDDAFEVFDHDGGQMVDVREIGTIIRSLGCCPSEAELHDMLAEHSFLAKVCELPQQILEEEETPGSVRLSKFLPLMTQVLLERRYKPATEDELMKAFQTLDTEGQGFLTQDQLTKVMMEEGEPFTQEEMEEMLSAALNPETGQIVCKDFVPLMMLEETS